MTTLMTRMFRDRCSRCQVGQGRDCACRAKKPRRLRIEATPTSFWWAYALLLVAVAALWRVCA